MNFPTLREFLTLTDPTDKYERPIIEHDGDLPGFDWVGERLVARYDIAKYCFETYGDASSLVGQKVVTLRAGLGGWAGVTRTLEGEYKDDARFFLLSGCDGGTYIILKDYWWMAFAPPAAVKKIFGEKLDKRRFNREWWIDE